MTVILPIAGQIFWARLTPKSDRRGKLGGVMGHIGAVWLARGEVVCPTDHHLAVSFVLDVHCLGLLLCFMPISAYPQPQRKLP